MISCSLFNDERFESFTIEITYWYLITERCFERLEENDLYRFDVRWLFIIIYWNAHKLIIDIIKTEWKSIKTVLLEVAASRTYALHI